MNKRSASVPVDVAFKNLFDKSKDPMVIFSLDGKIHELNSSAGLMLGMEIDQQGINLSNYFLKKEEWDYFTDALQEDEEVNDLEISIKGKGNKRRQCEVNALLNHVSSEGETFYQAVIKDIGQEKKATHDLVSQEKLAVTGRIARTIAHEVRNPLTNVNLALEQLKSEIQGFNEDHAMYFDIIYRNCDRINQLLTQLLNSSKPTELQCSNKSINTLMDEVLEQIPQRFKMDKIKIVKDYASDIPDVPMDAEKVRIAMMNIISNSVEAIGQEGGEILIKTEFADDKCKVIISDNGPGIKSESLNRIFEPFFSGKPKATGLGLTTALTIMLNHKGSIEVESEAGKGSAFTVYFIYPEK